MQQQMSSLAPHTASLCPRLRAADGRSPASSGGRGHRVSLLTDRARHGKVTAANAAARPKYRGFRGSAIAAPQTSRLLDQHAATTDASNPQYTPTIRKEDVYFQVEMMVQDDELDEYGVVNNSIYASYIHSGRDALLENLGIGVDFWASTGNAMAVTELNLKYFAPLRSGDKFLVKVRPVQIKGVRMIMHHLIETLPDRKLVLDARATIVFLDKSYRPTRVFPKVAAAAWEKFACKEG